MAAVKHCHLCGATDRPHRHHIDWDHTNNAAANVTWLCERCHVAVHQAGYLSRAELAALAAKVRARAPQRFESQQPDLFTAGPATPDDQ